MPDPDLPQTLEGFYVLHDAYRIDWPRWRALPAKEREAAAAEAARWLQGGSLDVSKGESAAYAVLGQKADVLFLHYRESPFELKQVELALRQCQIFAYLQPAMSYLSVIEVSLGEAAAIAAKRLADRGLAAGSAAYDEAFAREMAVQRQRLEGRLRPVIPNSAYICFYPMSKRRGEQVNWYTLSADERRAMMRNHGRIGHKYHQEVTQVIGGSIGLDDWEWGISLHADDCLVFKKLIHEMRFDPSSALYAEFGPFLVGIRGKASELPAYLSGKMG